MAILSNINGKFAVESSGAIQLSGSAGTSGYVLKSNGTGSAASWIDPTTIIGGPYLPLSGGTLTGATATASGISFTVGGNLTGTTATFTGVLALPDGSVSAPSIGNTGDTNTGMYWPGDHQLGFAVNGSRKFYMSTTKAFFQNLSSGVEINAGGIDVTGDSTFAGDVMPDAENAYNIGSASLRWEDLYVDDGFIRDAYIDTNIYHNGDTDTYINFTTDTIKLATAGGFGFELDSNRDINSPDRLYMRQTRFGYSSAYKVVQFGNAASTSAISLGYNPSSNTNGGFSGNEILIPNNIRILAPNAADNQFYGVMMFDSNDKLLIGSSNYLIDSNYIMAMDPSTKRVGIGTTSPDRLLDVSGTGNVYAKIQSTNSTAAGIELDTAGGSTENWLIQADEGVDGLAIYDLGRTSYRMVIDDSGYVGIGNTNPQTQLQVTSNTTTKLRVNTTGVADSMVEILGYDAGLHIGDNTNGNRWAIWNDGPGTSTSLNFGSYALGTWYVPGSQVMTMASNGKVGIGVSSGITRQLEVNTSGGWNNGISLNSSSTDGAGLRLNCSSSGGNEWYLISTGSGNGGGTGNLGFYNNTVGAYQMYITSSGNVGIGDTSPAKPLVVYSAAPPGGITIKAQSGNASNWIQNVSTGSSWQMGSTSTGWQLYNDNTSGYRVTVTNAGNVGIGTTSPDAKIHIEGGASDQKVLEISTAQSDGPYTAYKNRSSGTTTLGFIGNSQGIMNSGTTNFGIRANNNLTFSSGGSSERMRISSNGYIGMNEVPSGFATLEIKNISSTTYGLYVDYTDTSASYGAMKVILTGASTSPSFVDWWYGASQVGSVVTTGSSTQYLTSSDYRLKENIVSMSNAIDRVKQLKPSRFNFIGHENTVDGLIAHEVAEVVPEAVNGEKDGLRDDGTPKYQGIDEGKLVPLLIGAIQELEARVKELENK